MKRTNPQDDKAGSILKSWEAAQGERIEKQESLEGHENEIPEWEGRPPLLRYPFSERPLERGLPRRWT
jgi:hypothetical protein